MTRLTRRTPGTFAGLAALTLSLAGCGSESVKANDSSATKGGSSKPEMTPEPTAAADDDMAAADDTMAADDTAAPAPVDTSGGMLMVDFDGWNGSTALTTWTFEFGPNEDPYTGGMFELSDDTGDYVLQMVDGHDSQYALNFSNTKASDWGGGVGFYMGKMDGAVDVTGYSGVAFWVKGTTPAGTMEISFGRAETDCEDGETCSRSSVKFDTPAKWTQMSFDWSEFSAGISVSGDEYTLPAPDLDAVAFNIHMIYAQDASSGDWLPEPGAFDVTVDDITFY